MTDRERDAMVDAIAKTGVSLHVLNNKGQLPDDALEAWYASLQRGQVENYAARNRRAFAEAAGPDSDKELVRAFAALQRRDPSISAAKFLERGAGVNMGGVPDQAVKVPQADARRDAGRSDESVRVNPGENRDRLKPRQDQVSGSTMGLVRPAHTFAESREAISVVAHFHKFSEQFRRIGTSEKELTDAFFALRRRRPNLSAADFLACR